MIAVLHTIGKIELLEWIGKRKEALNQKFKNAELIQNTMECTAEKARLLGQLEMLTEVMDKWEL